VAAATRRTGSASMAAANAGRSASSLRIAMIAEVSMTIR
jgi:hypothetical protein